MTIGRRPSPPQFQFSKLPEEAGEEQEGRDERGGRARCGRRGGDPPAVKRLRRAEHVVIARLLWEQGQLVEKKLQLLQVVLCQVSLSS